MHHPFNHNYNHGDERSELDRIRTFRKTMRPVLDNEAIMAIRDQYSVWTGLSYTTPPLVSTSLGGCFDCVPVLDLLGSYEGFSFSGNVLSLDPDVSFMKNM